MKFRMMRLLAAAALATGVAAGAAAQQPPAAPPAAAASIAPSHLAAARALALQLKVDDPIRAVLDEMQVQVIETFTKTRPELTVDLKQVMQDMNPDIAQKREDLVNAGARAFATRFTEPEIGELQKFFASPLGQKYLRDQPAAMTEYFGQLQQWIGSINEFVIQRVRADMKKKGHDL